MGWKKYYLVDFWSGFFFLFVWLVDGEKSVGGIVYWLVKVVRLIGWFVYVGVW